MSTHARTYAGAIAASGPLLYVERTHGAALGEHVVIEVPGQPARRGQIIDAGRDVTVIQVFEETVGLLPAHASITLSGELVTAAVGRELLGRVLSGAGRALDGLPEPIGEARRPVWGAPLNPVRRRAPASFIETGVSAIDGMNTLVRGQKLPIFSAPGLPMLELAGQVVESARAGDEEPFAIVFAGIGITEREAHEFVARLDAAGATSRSVVYLNRAGDPTLERLIAPRLALTTAEHLAFEHGFHVLVVMADITQYCEALREVAAAREEIPGRRGYPGYMYTDLATLFERAGIVEGRGGSITQLPLLTMPDDDVTHPIPDLTGYITEGQIVLGRDLHARGISPPIDVLPSLSRLMNRGIGEGRTIEAHRRWADQLYAVYARGREATSMATIVGRAGLTAADARALELGDRFEHELIHQGAARRSTNETLQIGWRLLAALPREDLTRLDDTTWQRHVAPLRDGEARLNTTSGAGDTQ